MHTACCRYYKGPCLLLLLNFHALPLTTNTRFARLAHPPRFAYLPDRRNFCFFQSARPSVGPLRSHGNSNSADTVDSSAASQS